MTVTIPNLRKVSAQNHTVPAGQTWIIKTLLLVGEAVGPITFTNSGSFFALQTSEAFPATIPGFDGNSPGRRLTTVLVANAGDTFAFGAPGNSIEIGYWILETDFGLNISIPDLRKSSISTDTAESSTITIPAGQTWILKLSSFKAISLDVAKYTFTVSTTIGANTLALLKYRTDDPTTVYGQFLQSTLALKAGNVLTLTQDRVNGSSQLDIGYWILEQDF